MWRAPLRRAPQFRSFTGLQGRCSADRTVPTTQEWGRCSRGGGLAIEREGREAVESERNQLSTPRSPRTSSKTRVGEGKNVTDNLLNRLLKLKGLGAAMSGQVTSQGMASTAAQIRQKKSGRHSPSYGRASLATKSHAI